MTYRFPPFELDARECRLLRSGEVVDTAPKVLDALALLVARAGRLVTKDEILTTVWPGVEVTDNALTQVVSDLRRVLGDRPESPTYIETVPRRGYRFIAAVEPVVPEPQARAAGSVTGLRAGTRETSSAAAFDAFVDGRRKLERMVRAEVESAIADFERATALEPLYALPYVGLAHAKFWLFEMSRVRNRRDAAILTEAIADAHRATDLDPDLPEAHAALALLLSNAGRLPEAIAAGRRAIVLEPGNWRNHCRLALAAWGSPAVHAWTRVLELYPEFAFAHYGLAMASIARQDLAAAEDSLRRGAALQDRAAGREARFPARGCHWLLGAVRLALGDTAEARAEFARERASAGPDVYSVEFALNAWNGEGFALLAEGAAEAAAGAFEHALEMASDQARSWLGLALAHGRAGDADRRRHSLHRARTAIDELRVAGRAADAAIAAASVCLAEDRPDEAVSVLDHWLTTAPPGQAGWMIPIEPGLLGLHGRRGFADVLARVKARAT